MGTVKTKDKEVIINTVYTLGKLVKPTLDKEEVIRMLEVRNDLRVEEQGVVGTEQGEESKFTFTGKLIAETEVMEEPPPVIHTALDKTIKNRTCHLDKTYIFSGDGRVYDGLYEGYIEPNKDYGTVQITIDRLVINVPKRFIQFYVNEPDESFANKELEDAVLTLRTKSIGHQNKQKEEEVNARYLKEKEAQSERYHHHKEVEGMHLFHTPYVLTAEGRVFDKELGKLRAVNNRGYSTNLRKGFTTPMNLSINNIKHMLETQDFTILIERGGYTEHQCNKMWEYCQKQQQDLHTEDELQSEELQSEESKTSQLDKIALEAGFVRTKEGYFEQKRN